MKIFFSESEINYNNNHKYAFLNWRFDNGQGSNDKRNPKQSVFDNFEMGKAYLANAILTLYSIVYTRNGFDQADSLIFPALFNAWHSIELLLKSGINALAILSDGNPAALNHDIFTLKNAFVDALNGIGMNTTVTNGLVNVNYLLSEFSKVGARFDFARYTFDPKGNYQFYNSPYSDSEQWQIKPPSANNNTIVPNTCVDIEALLELLCNINSSFRELIFYLTCCISEYEKPCNAGFDQFKKTKDCVSDSDGFVEEKDPMMKIMNYIYMQIL
ncbi:MULTISPECIES: hypothetical protein [unclassified Sedimentibacter]|uniref:hypothetical protein n=1 Tax=unclassified Sedimentibacter TaxID=2649220 RepID=UPI0027DFCE7D|nr:hypothetical protein [Sedimentibacter sp. MB35-C1]WMJ77314.1 hypothetical protein RBQ61_17380 [Sedimentibacter sp. MB35-C1]